MRAAAIFLVASIAICVPPSTRADVDIASTNPKAAAAISAVKQLCLAGTQFDLKADARGNLTLEKLQPGGTGSVSVNVRNSTGAAAIFDDKVRQIADEDIRRCIQPHISKIVDAILGQNENPQPANDKAECMAQNAAACSRYSKRRLQDCADSDLPCRRRAICWEDKSRALVLVAAQCGPNANEQSCGFFKNSTADLRGRDCDVQ
jgi:hypothetical protein